MELYKPAGSSAHPAGTGVGRAAAGLVPTMPVAGAKTLVAPAKLTLSLRVTGTRPDGYHLIDSEMVTINLFDTLTFEPGRGIATVDNVVGAQGLYEMPESAANLVHQALVRVGRDVAVRLVKTIPIGAGLGGGSADAAAVLRWAGRTEIATAARLGSDVPFCVSGGRARVTGVGEVVEPLEFQDRRFVLLIPPIVVDTGSVYKMWDSLAWTGGGVRTANGSGNGAGVAGRVARGGNDLEAPAVAAAPELARWRDALGDLTGRSPRLAGSGSTWFVEGEPDQLGIGDRTFLVLRGARAPLVAVRTVPPMPLVPSAES